MGRPRALPEFDNNLLAGKTATQAQAVHDARRDAAIALDMAEQLAAGRLPLDRAEALISALLGAALAASRALRSDGYLAIRGIDLIDNRTGARIQRMTLGDRRNAARAQRGRGGR